MYIISAKVMIREFVHYRYGVFEESGFLINEKGSKGDKFPYMFTNIRGEHQINTCNNIEIEGKFSNRYYFTYFDEFYISTR